MIMYLIGKVLVIHIQKCIPYFVHMLPMHCSTLISLHSVGSPTGIVSDLTQSDDSTFFFERESIYNPPFVH